MNAFFSLNSVSMRKILLKLINNSSSLNKEHHNRRVSISDFNQHRFLLLYFSACSLALEKICQELKTVFDYKPNTSKLVKLKCSATNRIFKSVFGNAVKHTSLFWTLEKLKLKACPNEICLTTKNHQTLFGDQTC